MSELSGELLEIKTAIVRLEGSVSTLAVEMRSGDRDASSGVKLLAKVVENQESNMAEYRKDLKEAMKEFREHTEAIKESSAQQANAVRVSLEGQLKKHADEDPAPHETTLGTRIDTLERRNTQIGVIIALLTFIGWPGLLLFAQYILN